MTGKSPNTPTVWTDPDDAPELTDDFFELADEFRGKVLVRKGGRPKSANPKRPVSIRLDSEVLDHFQSAGPGWQSRINETLRKAVGLG